MDVRGLMGGDAWPVAHAHCRGQGRFVWCGDLGLDPAEQHIRAEQAFQRSGPISGPVGSVHHVLIERAG